MAECTTLDRLERTTAEVLRLECVDPDTGIVELGLDSVRVIELILLLEQVYGTSIQPERLSVDQSTTLRDIDRQMLELLPLDPD